MVGGGHKKDDLVINNNNVFAALESLRRKKKDGSSSKQQEQKEHQQHNPNWEQLRQKLKSYGSKKRLSKTPQELEDSILGKRKERESNEEFSAAQTNPLIPTSSDSSITESVAMDCEMVGISSLNSKSALGRVTLVNKWGNVIYDEFVRPIDRVVDFRTQISGIRPHHLRKAKDFISVQKEVAELLKGRILVGHALHNDLRALLLSHPKKDTRDTSQYQLFLKEGRSRALRHLAVDFLGVEIQSGEHCPIEDARAAMLLYQKNRKKWEKTVKDMIKQEAKQKRRKPKSKLKTSLLNVNGTAAS